MHRPRVRLGLLLGLVGLVGVVLGLVLSARLSLFGSAHAAPPPVPPQQVTPATPPTGSGVSFVRLAKEVGPAVVSINVKITRQSSESSGGFPYDPFGQFGGPEIGEGQGSGFIIAPEGYVLTNDHVVGEASDIKVALADGRELPGKVVGSDSRTDIALVKIDSKQPLPYVRLGDSDKAEIGEWVIAIGNPFGLDHTVTAGIISAKGRHNIRPSGRRGLYDFIQTDASINPGNSGGPLINVNGEVIGINAAVNAAGQGISFAIPINMAKALVPQFKEHGKVERSYMGVGIQDLSRELAKSYGLSTPDGAIVNKVSPGSPAEKAGLKEGDVITQFNGKPVHSANDLAWLASTAGAGKSADVVVAGKGGTRTVKVTLAAAPDEESASGERGRLPKAGGGGKEVARLGLEVTKVTPDIAQELDLDKARGVAITRVDRKGVAAGVLQRGDVIVTVNDQPVNDDDSFNKAVGATSRGDTLRLLVVRQGQPMFLAFTLQ
jgi:serine protease Do